MNRNLLRWAVFVYSFKEFKNFDSSDRFYFVTKTQKLQIKMIAYADGKTTTTTVRCQLLLILKVSLFGWLGRFDILSRNFRSVVDWDDGGCDIAIVCSIEGGVLQSSPWLHTLQEAILIDLNSEYHFIIGTGKTVGAYYYIRIDVEERPFQTESECQQWQSENLIYVIMLL